jgi:hypothetical protein
MEFADVDLLLAAGFLPISLRRFRGGVPGEDQQASAHWRGNLFTHDNADEGVMRRDLLRPQPCTAKK